MVLKILSGDIGMPTFKMFKDGELVDEMVGDEFEKLTEMIEKYLPKP